jgi:hypothetical protein
MEQSDVQFLSCESMNINHHCDLSSNVAYCETSGALSALSSIQQRIAIE